MTSKGLEVDVTTGLFTWQSVPVFNTLYFIYPNLSDKVQEIFRASNANPEKKKET